jgi:antitoxin component of RelBE/YafQ-DinJ toxin-antitoxin module
MMSVVLSFREEGPAYERAKAVADAMGVTVSDYLLACIAEGNKVLRLRHQPSEANYEEPTFMRWGVLLGE